MEASFSIEQALPEHAAAITAHNLAMALETEGIHLDPAVTGPGVEAVFQDASLGFYLVALAGEEVVGNLMITIEWSDWRNCELWWFQSVYVQPAWRKHGVFRAMYRRVEEMARAQGVKELRLYVERENVRAQQTYRSMGMQLSHYDMFEVKL